MAVDQIIMADLQKIRVSGNRLATADGASFVPFGVNYYRPGTGWAPQIWKQFDADATRRDFARLRELGGNCVRVFLTWGSMYNEPGVMNEEGLAKLDRFIELAAEAGLYVHPTGPDGWEGWPQWVRQDRFADDRVLDALEFFWKKVASRYKGRATLFAYDLLNEPTIQWQSPVMRPKWNAWVRQRHGSIDKAQVAWKLAGVAAADAPVPVAQDKVNDPHLLDYQQFREQLADEWTGRQAAAIKAGDPDALVTVGLIQWSVPVLLPKLEMYAAYRPGRLARYLDFLEFHFYPLEGGVLDYANQAQFDRNLAYVEALAREVARPGKPVVVAEYGWHGGGTFPQGQSQSKPGTEEDQARWCSSLIQVTAGLACGWLNWGFHDHPQARDVSVHTGLLTPDGKDKAWARQFKVLAGQFQRGLPKSPDLSRRPRFDWDAAMTSPSAAARFREEYCRSFPGKPSAQP